jgi:hypothetical protein
MGLDKSIQAQLKRFADAFKEARERGANESDTVMYLVKFFEDVLGFDSLKGELSKEVAIKDRYCDMAVKLEGEIQLLVEAKAASLKGLSEKSIEQAENYASRKGIEWVILTNGIEWKLFHLTFTESDGIAHDLAFSANLLEQVEQDAEGLWANLSLLSKTSMKKRELTEFWSRKKILCPASVVKVLLAEPVLAVVRRELNREAPARLDIMDVFNAVRDALSKEALAEAGDLNLRSRKKRRKRKIQQKDPTTGQITEQEIEEEDNETEASPAATASKPTPPTNPDLLT